MSGCHKLKLSKKIKIYIKKKGIVINHFQNILMLIL